MRDRVTARGTNACGSERRGERIESVHSYSRDVDDKVGDDRDVRLADDKTTSANILNELEGASRSTRHGDMDGLDGAAAKREKKKRQTRG